MIFQLSEVPEFYTLTSIISLDSSFVPPPLTKFENGQIALLLPKTVDLHFTQKTNMIYLIYLCYFKNCMPFFFQTSKSGTFRISCGYMTDLRKNQTEI